MDGRIRIFFYQMTWQSRFYCLSIRTMLLPHKKKTYQANLVLICSNEFEAYTLMLNLPYFLSWHCLGVIDPQLYRKRLFEFSTLGWGQRGIILIYRLFLARFSFVNIILYLILAKVSSSGLVQWSTAHNISILPQLISMNIDVTRNRSMTKQTNLPPNSHITLDALLCAFHRGVLCTTVNPNTCRIHVDRRIPVVYATCGREYF